MPYRIVKRKGKKPWKILRKKNGKWGQVGSSTSKTKAQASIRARYANKK